MSAGRLVGLTQEERVGVSRALLRHPEWRGRLERAATADSSLADVCGCYASAWRGYEFWCLRAGAEAGENLAEYEAHIARIEADIDAWLARLG